MTSYWNQIILQTCFSNDWNGYVAFTYINLVMAFKTCVKHFVKSSLETVSFIELILT